MVATGALVPYKPKPPMIILLTGVLRLPAYFLGCKGTLYTAKTAFYIATIPAMVTLPCVDE